MTGSSTRALSQALASTASRILRRFLGSTSLCQVLTLSESLLRTNKGPPTLRLVTALTDDEAHRSAVTIGSSSRMHVDFSNLRIAFR